jgi:hypothetical protein
VIKVGVVWLVAPESATSRSWAWGSRHRQAEIKLKQPTRDCGSHSLNHGVEDGDCYDGGRGVRGGVNENPTHCTEKPYWGATKKACYTNQYGAPSMDRLKDGQAPTTAVVDKGSTTPTAVPTRAPTSTAAAKGPAGPTGALTPATEKGRPTKGWGCETTVAPATVPAGAPVATTAPTARSREAAVAWTVAIAAAKSVRSRLGQGQIGPDMG